LITFAKLAISTVCAFQAGPVCWLADAVHSETRRHYLSGLLPRAVLPGRSVRLVLLFGLIFY